MTELLRAAIFHTPGNPFAEPDVLVAPEDGGLAVADGRVIACGDYSDVRAAHPDAEVRDWRGGFILPGFVDTHVHFPQVRIIGGLGYSLLEWLEQLALPEEARLADVVYASAVACEFVNALAAHGTTTALVFGSHFAPATAALFDAAAKRGLRVFSGLVLSDRVLPPELHQSPNSAWRESKALAERFHGVGRLGYAVMPRFALSCSGAMLEICGELMREDSTFLFTTHINENRREIEEVGRLFASATDYLDIYEGYGLVGPLSVLAHNVHTTDAQMDRIAERGATIAHCPCSNAALGSGIFPMKRHLDRGVRLALGTDVGGGTGFGMMKEALQAYMQQRVAPDPLRLTPAQMLYLATRAGAEALGLGNETGDFTPGKAADLVYLRPVEGSVLEGVLKHTEAPERKLAVLFTMAGAECVKEVRVGGDRVFHAA